MAIAVTILGGLAVLVLGAELLVRGAVRLAEGAGVSPLLIGLTVVGFGTSTPELVTSVQGALMGSPGIAVGNIVGSNLFNILAILGLAALVRPLAVADSALRRDGVILVAMTVAFLGVGLFGSLDRPTGAVFLAALAAYLTYAWWQERGGVGGHTAAFDRAEAAAEAHLAPVPGLSAPRAGWLVPAALALAGLFLLVIGARLFVGGSIGLARGLGVSEAVIGLTIVAAGTSLPELATSLLAAFRRQADVAIGNILGSNLYNFLGIGGATALIAPTAVPEGIARFDMPILLGVTALLLWFLYTGRRLSRGEGAVLFAAYLAYVWLIWPV